jgi:hypothetical protein
MKHGYGMVPFPRTGNKRIFSQLIEETYKFLVVFGVKQTVVVGIQT